jgi:predicted small secreted protein
MKKLFLALGMLIATGVILPMAVRADAVSVKKDISVPSSTKEQIFNKVGAWAGSFSQVYQKDAQTGEIVAYGEISYPSAPVDRIQYSFVFKMKNAIQGNRDIVTFEDVMLKSPTEYNTETNEKIIGDASPVRSTKDIAAANKALSYVADNLKNYLLGTGDTTNQLVKCPDCRLLTTTPVEMKEHMKMHGK